MSGDRRNCNFLQKKQYNQIIWLHFATGYNFLRLLPPVNFKIIPSRFLLWLVISLSRLALRYYFFRHTRLSAFRYCQYGYLFRHHTIATSTFGVAGACVRGCHHSTASPPVILTFGWTVNVLQKACCRTRLAVSIILRRASSILTHCALL